MVLVAKEASRKVLYKGEAWEEGATEKAIKWAIDNGYTPIADEVTLMGNLIIWVR